MRRDENMILVVSRLLITSLALFSCLAFSGRLAYSQQPIRTSFDYTTGVTTHVYADDRYGTEGRRFEYSERNGSRIVKRVWTNRENKTLEEETITYSTPKNSELDPTGNEKTVVTKIFSPAGLGNRVSKQTTTKTDLTGKEFFSETRVFDENNAQIGGTRTEEDSNGKKKTSTWDPQRKDYIADVSSVASRSADNSPQLNAGGPPGTGPRETTYADPRYGTSGTRTDTIGGDGKVRKRVWKDNNGRELEEETTIYGRDNQKTVDTRFFNPLPDGGRRLGKLTTTKTDPKGNEIYNEVKTFDQSNNRIGGHRIEVDSTGEKKKYNWDPQKKDYVEGAADVSTRTDGGVGSTPAAGGFGVRSNEYGGTTSTYGDNKHGGLGTGTREESLDDRGRVRERVWRDNTGRVRETEKTTYDQEGRKEVVTTQFKPNAGPDGASSMTTVKTDPKGNEVSRERLIGYNFKDVRYGEQGVRRDLVDERTGRVHQRTWEDNKGRVLEEETVVYGTGDQKTVITTIFNPMPNGELRQGTVTTVKTDPKGNEVSRETQMFDAKGEQIGGTRTRLESGERKTYRWEPRKKDYVEEAAGVSAPAARAGGSSSAAPGFAAASEVNGGLSVATFTTPQGTVYVNLPSDIAAGDTLSGTVVAQPKGEDPKQRTRNEDQLGEYVVELGERRITISAGRISLALRSTIGSTTDLVLRDKQGKELCRSEIPVASSLPAISDFTLPALGQQGHAIEIPGVFDGKFETTRIQIGDQEMQLLAESPRRLLFRNTSERVGLNKIELREGDKTRSGQFRSLGIKLSAPKLDLLRGEGTTLTIVVTGLEDLRENIPLDIENKSPGVIAMSPSNSQRVMITPGEVRQGTYTTTRSLTGIQPGGFTITGTVTRKD